MSGRIPRPEAALAERLSVFVSQHADQGILWLMVRRGAVWPETAIHHVEFQTDRQNIYDDVLDPDAENDWFHMQVSITPDWEEEDPVVIEHYLGDEVSIEDDRRKFGVIFDEPGSARRRNRVRYAGRLLDELVELENAGHFVPAHRRKVSF